MERGFLKSWRRTQDSWVFQNPGVFKVWMWCLWKAAVKEHWVTVSTGRGETQVLLKPGQFIFGRHTAAKDLQMKPSTIRDRMALLVKHENLDTQPDTHYSVITIRNWEIYQYIPNEDTTGWTTGNRQPTDTKKNDKNISKEISALKSRYADQDIIDRAFRAITSIRKGGKVADSIILAELKYWSGFSVEQVEIGIQKYLAGGHAAQGKGEKYLRGIIRGVRKADEAEKTKQDEWMEKFPLV